MSTNNYLLSAHMSFLRFSTDDDVHQLLTQLQSFYWDLMSHTTLEKSEYYRQWIKIIEKARPLPPMLVEDCYIILEEFLPEYQIMQIEHSKVVLLK